MTFCAIALMLVYLFHKRPARGFQTLALLFAAFIFFCGISRGIAVWTDSHPASLLEATGKMLTAALSVVTILALIRKAPKILKMALVSDITQRKQIEDELKQANAEVQARETMLRTYLESAPQGVLVSDSEGRIVLVNRRTEQMFGYDRSELLGKEIELLVPARLRPGHRSMRADYCAAPVIRPMESRRELVALSKQGMEFPVEIGLSYIPGENGILCLSLVSDISDRKLAADQLARVNAELRRSNAELEQFAYIASHDLQEPLRMVTSYLDLLRRRYSDQLDGNAQEFIRYAVEGSVRMKELIRDVLSFSRAGTRALATRAVDAREILNTALDNLQAAIAERGAVVTAGELPCVLADPGLLVQIFQNLIGNAIKFTPEGTPRVHVAAELQKGEWVFSVKDNGIGIDSAYRERIFRIFERLHPADQYPGTGVGLAVCKKIVERHGGRIWLESEPGRGSVFYFTIAEKVTENIDYE